jgi:hypothetical protein
MIYAVRSLTDRFSGALVSCDGKPVGITQKAFDTLLVLVQDSGHLLLKRRIDEGRMAGQLCEGAKRSYVRDPNRVVDQPES